MKSKLYPGDLTAQVVNVHAGFGREKLGDAIANIHNVHVASLLVLSEPVVSW